MSGYPIDWIIRAVDRGFRRYRFDEGWRRHSLFVGASGLTNPPLLWQIQIQGDVIRLHGDGQLTFECTDGTYRQGHFGVWAIGGQSGAGLHLLVDDVRLGTSFYDTFDPSGSMLAIAKGPDDRVVLTWQGPAGTPERILQQCLGLRANF